MTISFKISKKGRRYKPKPCLSPATFHDKIFKNSMPNASSRALTLEGRMEGSGDDILISCSSTYDIPRDHEVSFTLKLYPEGYFIGKPSQNGSADEPAPHDAPQSLRRYNRASETLFSAIESGLLPVEVSEEISFKYVDGSVICEVQDCRDCAAEQGLSSQINSNPVINRVRLNMSLENVVRDLPLIADDSWTYNEFLEAEARIVKTLRPNLCLDPAPNLDRLCGNTQPIKLNLIRRNRPRHVPEVSVESNSMNTGNLMVGQNVGLSNKLGFKPNPSVQSASSPKPPPVSNMPMHQARVGSYARNIQEYRGSGIPSFLRKRDNQDWKLPPMSGSNKKSRLSFDTVQQQQTGHKEKKSCLGSAMSRDNVLLHQEVNGSGISSYSKPTFEKIENAENLSSQFGGSSENKTQMAGNDVIQLHPDSRVDPKFPKHSQSSVASNLSVRGNMSLKVDEKNTLMQQQKQAQVGSRSNMPVATEIGSPPAGVDNSSVPVKPSSPLIRRIKRPAIDETTMLDRFSKIEAVTKSNRLNLKRTYKAEECSKNPRTHSLKTLSGCFANISNNEYFKDETRPLSKSVMGGTLNTFKTRVLNFWPGECVLEGNASSIVPGSRSRMFMSEKPVDGTVAWYYGEVKDGDVPAEEDHLSTLPNTMAREGYLVEDRLEAKRSTVDHTASSSQQNDAGLFHSYSDQYVVTFPRDVIKPTATGDIPENSYSRTLQMSKRLLSEVTEPERLQEYFLQQRSLFQQDSEFLLQQQAFYQQKQQQALVQQNQQFPFQQNQQSLLLQQLPNQMPTLINPLQHLPMIVQSSAAQLGVQPSPIIRDIEQRQRQLRQQQQRQMMMLRLSRSNVQNMGSNIDIPRLGNPMGTRGISRPMPSVSGFGNNIGQLNPMSLNLLSSLGRVNYTAALDSTQTSTSGLLGHGEMHQGCSTDPPITGINYLELAAQKVGYAGTPNPMSGMNVNINQEQQQQQQQQQQNQQQQQQQQQQGKSQQHPQEAAPIFQALCSPQTGSSSTIGIPSLVNQPRQWLSPQQTNQGTMVSPPMGSGAVRAAGARNPEASSFSPQSSSETFGSLDSITNCPLDPSRWE